MAASNHRMITPEAVSLESDVAGLGSRMIAIIIDTLIQAGGVIALSFAFFAPRGGGTTLLVVYLVLVFLLVWGYFPLLEGLWGGRTPGKRAQRLRVVTTDGQPATFGPILIRNLLRLIDFLPGYYIIGALTILLTKRSQRLGDLAAGTIVVRERLVPVPAPLAVGPSDPSLPGVDTSAISGRHYELVRSFLERRNTFSREARSALAAQMASSLRPLTGWHGPVDDEAFLETVFRSYRERNAPAPFAGGTSSPTVSGGLVPSPSNPPRPDVPPPVPPRVDS